jgi:hypothetical protein
MSEGPRYLTFDDGAITRESCDAGREAIGSHSSTCTSVRDGTADRRGGVADWSGNRPSGKKNGMRKGIDTGRKRRGAEAWSSGARGRIWCGMVCSSACDSAASREEDGRDRGGVAFPSPAPPPSLPQPLLPPPSPNLPGILSPISPDLGPRG